MTPPYKDKTELARRRYNERAQAGLCPLCGGERVDGYKVCAKHLAKRLDWWMNRGGRAKFIARYREARAEGRCLNCRERLRPDMDGAWRTCAECRKAKRVQQGGGLEPRRRVCRICGGQAANDGHDRRGCPLRAKEA